MDKEFLDGLGVSEDASAKILEAYSTGISKFKLDTLLERSLESSKAKNFKAVTALLDMDKVKLSEDGNITGLTEQISALKAADTTSFLFESEKEIKGAMPGEKGVSGAADINLDNMSYEQLCEHFN